MKAILYEQYGPPEVLRLKEVDQPIPGPKEILIKIRASAVTMGDCEMRSPEIPNLTWFMVRLFFGLRKPRRKILGSYFAGEVEAIGPSVTSYNKGDRLFGISQRFGAHAAYLCLPETSTLTALPSNMTFEEAAPVALGLDSLHFLKKAKIKKGDEVLINGAGGGIGTYAVQLAAYYGARVTAVDSGDKLAMLRDIGAREVIDYRAGDFSNNGPTYDIVFDVVGALSPRRGCRLLKDRGRYISAIPLLSRVLPHLWISLTGNKKMMTGLTTPRTEALEYISKLIMAGQLKTVVDRCYALEQMAEAHRYIEQGLKK
ncbi:MAG TPA: NAD(P)-dependent alcohol dehydrogenase, partial [Eudoraea sp.]|nr:NAD(P)-dependent alcohol dehydrogenase [Eudoraea sp.]